MKILRTRENGRPHPRAKEKLGSLSHPSRVTVPFSFSFPSSLHLSLAHFLSSLDTSVHARLRTRTTWTPTSVARTGGPGRRRLIPVPRGSRSTPHLREGVAASQTFRAETRFLTGNFVRLRLPPLQQRQLLRRQLARRWSSSSSVTARTDNLVCRFCTSIDKNLSSRISKMTHVEDDALHTDATNIKLILPLVKGFTLSHLSFHTLFQRLKVSEDNTFILYQ